MQKNTKKIKYKNTLLAKCSIIFLKGDALFAKLVLSTNQSINSNDLREYRYTQVSW
jgi:hypothetical protein